MSSRLQDRAWLADLDTIAMYEWNPGAAEWQALQSVHFSSAEEVSAMLEGEAIVLIAAREGQPLNSQQSRIMDHLHGKLSMSLEELGFLDKNGDGTINIADLISLINELSK